MASLPYFDKVDLSSIDLCLISHFHLDHCGAVPYFLEKTNFKGKCYMTHPTKAIYKLLLSDFVKVSHVGTEQLFTEQDLNKSLDKIELIDYHQELEHNGIKFWCYNAGHVLGAAMFMIDIGGTRILYTGDFSRQSDRHLLGAETPSLSPDVMIVESTYGIQVHEERKEREKRFTKMVHDVVGRGGRCLIPVFALGRAQELLLILDEYWESHQNSHPELLKVPIYYASSLAQKCMKVFRTYINMMNEKIRKQFDISNPFVFKHISNLKNIDDFEDKGPCVIMASPGMLQSGLSLDLFERWCSDSKNGVVLPGYCVEGTLAKKIITTPKTVTLSNGQEVELKMTVKDISFSAHSDRKQTEEFISATKPSHVILVHGEKNNMMRLKQSLAGSFEKLPVYTPANTESVEIMFRGEKIAKVLGNLSKDEIEDSKEIKGLLVQKDFKYSIISKENLKSQLDISFSGITQKIILPLPDFDFIDSLKNRFKIEKTETEHTISIKCSKSVELIVDKKKKNQIEIRWNTNITNDLIADSILQILLNTKEQVHTASEASLMYTVYELLCERYEKCDFDHQNLMITIIMDDKKVIISKNGKVECDEKIKDKVEMLMKRIFMSLFPLPSCYDEVTCQDMLIEL